MLRTDKQLHKTKRRIGKLEIFRKQAIRAYHSVINDDASSSAALKALDLEIEKLKSQQQEFKSLYFGRGEMPDLERTRDIGKDFIRARIFLGWSKAFMATRCGIRQQQIERYEANEYAQASLARVAFISDVFLAGYEEHKVIMEERRNG